MIWAWLKKKHAREHAKLIWQNGRAQSLSVYYFETNQTAIGIKLCTITAHADGLVNEQLPTDATQAQQLLENNRYFRRYYDRAPGSNFKKFDELFRPVLGWEEFYVDRGL